jgi:poly(U)-binding-splicing factor PUF60
MALLASKGPAANNSACRIYVGSLTYDLTEEIIKVPFSVFGPIAKIEMPKENGHSKGYCFIDYTSPDHASNALTSMNGFIINGRPIKVNRSSQGTGVQGITTTIEAAQQARAEAAAKLAAIGIDSDVGVVSSVAPSTAIGPGKVEHRIYVGSVMFDLTADQLKEVFEPFGAVISCQLIPNPETGKHKGYGFIEFDNEKSAADAMQNMDGFDLCGRKLKVGRVSMANAPTAAAGGMSADALVALATMSSTSGLSTGFSVAALTAQARAMVSQKEVCPRFSLVFSVLILMLL